MEVMWHRGEEARNRKVWRRAICTCDPIWLGVKLGEEEDQYSFLHYREMGFFFMLTIHDN